MMGVLLLLLCENASLNSSILLTLSWAMKIWGRSGGFPFKVLAKFFNAGTKTRLENIEKNMLQKLMSIKKKYNNNLAA